MPDQVHVHVTGSTGIPQGAWEERVAILREHELDEVAAVLRTMTLRDETDAAWTYDGTTWQRWDGSNWVPSTPSGLIRLPEVVLDVFIPELDDALAKLAAADADDYAPTHVVPHDGMPVWFAPDPATAPVASLDPGLDVMAVEWRNDGWTRIVCSNGWGGWVDGRLLERDG